MKKIVLGALALVLGLALCGSEAKAHGPRHGGGGPRFHGGGGPGYHRGGGPGYHRGGHGHGHAHGRVIVTARPYYASHGVKYRGGYYYRGHHHNHWGFKVWNARYSRYHYWDPNLSCYYYYCPVQGGYFPCVD